MDIRAYHESITTELRSVRNRIRNLIEDRQWQTDGEWKESVLRATLRKYLPPTVGVGRGFVITPNVPSKQVDVLLYDTTVPILFRDGDLVFVTPDAVRGLIEVKSTATLANLRESMLKLQNDLHVLRQWWDGRPGLDMNRGTKQFSGIFAYDSRVNPLRVLDALRDTTQGNVHKVINIVSAGDSTFIRYWRESPMAGGERNVWRAYNLPGLAPSYFIGNTVNYCSPESVAPNRELWFPLLTKEGECIGTSPAG